MKDTPRKPVFFMTDEIKTPPMSVSATPRSIIDLCKKRLALYDTTK